MNKGKNWSFECMYVLLLLNRKNYQVLKSPNMTVCFHFWILKICMMLVVFELLIDFLRFIKLLLFLRCSSYIWMNSFVCTNLEFLCSNMQAHEQCNLFDSWVYLYVSSKGYIHSWFLISRELVDSLLLLLFLWLCNWYYVKSVSIIRSVG